MIACHMFFDMTPHPGVKTPKYQGDIFWLRPRPLKSHQHPIA